MTTFQKIYPLGIDTHFLFPSPPPELHAQLKLDNLYACSLSLHHFQVHCVSGTSNLRSSLEVKDKAAEKIVERIYLYF
jgi:hypothetical protein